MTATSYRTAKPPTKGDFMKKPQEIALKKRQWKKAALVQALHWGREDISGKTVGGRMTDNRHSVER